MQHKQQMLTDYCVCVCVCVCVHMHVCQRKGYKHWNNILRCKGSVTRAWWRAWQWQSVIVLFVPRVIVFPLRFLCGLGNSAFLWGIFSIFNIGRALFWYCLGDHCGCISSVALHSRIVLWQKWASKQENRPLLAETQIYSQKQLYRQQYELTYNCID